MLRIISIITGVGMIIYMVTILSMMDMYIRTDELWMLFMNQAVLAILLSHSIIVHFIFQKNYPNHEIQKPTRIYYKISTIATWILVSLLLLALLGMGLSRSEMDSSSVAARKTDIFIICVAAVAVLYIIQLILGAKFIKKIEYNVHCRMLSSFDTIETDH